MTDKTNGAGAGRPVAIVTGAGSGVGRDTVALLAEEGWACVLVSRTESALRETEAFVREEVEPDAVLQLAPADVSNAKAVQGVVEATMARFGRIDGLANVAGSAPLQPIDQITDEALDACLAVNLKAVIYLTRACWPVFKAQKSGAICNVSSMASLDPFPGFNMYAAAKAGVNLFTKASADEGAKLGIRAASIAPGAIETPMLRQHFPETMIPTEKTLDPILVAGAVRDVLTGRRQHEPGETIAMASP